MEIKNGLKPLTEKKFWQKQDFSHKATFGSVPVLPKEYILESVILNQGYTNKCTAYAACAAQETQHGIQFDPDWFYFQEGIVAGQHSDTGYELRVPMKTGVKKGFKVMNKDASEDEYKEDSYFRIDNPYDSIDLFDEIKQALYLAKDEKKCVITGVQWRDTWNTGIIPKEGGNIVGGHCIKVAGWKTINDIEYLVVPNSYGVKFGDKGYNYFPREVVNKDFVYGAFMWRSPATQEEIRTFSNISSLIKTILLILIEIIKLNQKNA